MTAHVRVIVVGAGVVGLTTAIRLLERGFSVEVVADRRHPGTTGNLAAGLWYPYKVGGDRVARWALASLATLKRLAEIPAAGVRLVKCTSLVRSDEKRPFWADEDVDFRESSRSGSDSDAAARAFEATLPVAEPSTFLPWLEARIETLGGFVRTLESPVGDLSELPARFVINCTGLGARHLCHDGSVMPIRGVVVRLAGSGIDECVTDETNPDQPTYIIPNRDFCVLGGSAQFDRWDVSVSQAEAEDVVARCARLDGRVRQGTILGAFAGLRPGRPEVRLASESLDDGRIAVHNYGHGGSGFTLAWGCADEVAEIVAARCY